MHKIRKLGTAEAYVIGLADPKTDEAVESADIIFLGRAGDVKALDMVKRLRDMGKKVVYDLDDSLFDISPFSPHYGQLGIMPVNVEPGGGMNKFDFWVPGEKGFDISRNRHIRKYFVQIIRAVNAVTVTTPPLQELYSRYNDHVYIVPNAIDFDIWRWNGVAHKSGNVRVIYAAGSNHQEDWFFVKSILEKLMVEIPGWTLVLMGVDWKGQWGTLDPKRIESVPWVDFESHPLSMALSCGDIGLAPIAEIDFNLCRSSIKWAEYAAIGAATIATDYGPYRRDCVNGKDAILCKTKQEWTEGLSFLILSEQKRREIAGNALKKVKRDYNLDFVADRWLSVFEEVNKQ
jgi:glycosyltransferase involved in cell wall biosynthesis